MTICESSVRAKEFSALLRLFELCNFGVGQLWEGRKFFPILYQFCNLCKILYPILLPVLKFWINIVINMDGVPYVAILQCLNQI